MASSTYISTESPGQTVLLRKRVADLEAQLASKKRKKLRIDLPLDMTITSCSNYIRISSNEHTHDIPHHHSAAPACDQLLYRLSKSIMDCHQYELANPDVRMITLPDGWSIHTGLGNLLGLVSKKGVMELNDDRANNSIAGNMLYDLVKLISDQALAPKESEERTYTAEEVFALSMLVAEHALKQASGRDRAVASDVLFSIVSDALGGEIAIGKTDLTKPTEDTA